MARTATTDVPLRASPFDASWRNLLDPGNSRDRRFAQEARDAASDRSGRTALVGALRTMHPTGLGDAVMKCQNLRTDLKVGRTVTSPICVWADRYTFGVVMVFDPSSLRNGGAGVSLGENADTAARIRNDARVPRQCRGVRRGRLGRATTNASAPQLSFLSWASITALGCSALPARLWA